MAPEVGEDSAQEMAGLEMGMVVSVMKVSEAQEWAGVVLGVPVLWVIEGVLTGEMAWVMVQWVKEGEGSRLFCESVFCLC